jgi:lipid A 4'-phosphatase
MSLRSRYLGARIFKWDWLVFIACLVFFEFSPNFDLYVSDFSWNPQAQFQYAEWTWVSFSYWLFSKMHFAYLAVLIYFLITRRTPSTSVTVSRLRLHAGFLLIALILGPGLVVNQVFKENWGRARPREVQEFGGINRYSPPLTLSKECDGNCSFVSGHAAGAFFILSLSWVFRQKRWLLLGLFLGALVGTGRVLQGGHFVSDVVFAFWAVYFSSLLTAMCFGLRSTDVDPSLPSASPRVFT